MNTQTDVTKNYRYFLQLMQSVLNNTEAKAPAEDVNFEAIYEIALKHSLAGMLYFAIEKLPQAQRPQGEFMPYLAQMYREQIVTDLNVSLEADRMLNVLSSKGIRCLPLKGIITKKDYPVEHLRTMVDVDILCDFENRPEIEKIFIENGYTKETITEKDTGFRKDEILHFEMHHSLLSTDSPAYDYFLGIWDRVEYTDGTKVARMSLEDTYIFMLEHLADHLVYGGAGIRMYMDVYMFLKKHSEALKRDYVAEILGKIGLLEFEKQTVKICNNWFSGNEEIDLQSSWAEFIFDSATFGRTKISFLSDTLRNDGGSSATVNGLRRILRKLFPKLSWMKLRFRAVQKLPLLYVVFVPVHWFDRLIVKRNVETKNIGGYFVTASSDEAVELKNTFISLGLKGRI